MHLGRTTLQALAATTALAALLASRGAAAPALEGPLPQPLPLFPADNWWNVDVTNAPVDPQSAAFITWIGASRGCHPDFGGDVSPGSVQNYGMPYVTVDGTQPKVAVQFQYSDESDGVDHSTNTSFPFYPIPIEAANNAHWVEGGDPGNVDLRSSQDRHLLIVDTTNDTLYEMWNTWYDAAGVQWYAGSGAFFDMKTNNRRPDGWTSADAAGLAILPGLVRYDEVYGPDEIGHAFRMTLRASNNYYVFPASHVAGNNTSAPPFGARMRLKASVDISGYTPDAQKIFRAWKKYGLIFADNGSDMYVTGTYDNRWDNGVLNPAFRSITASDFDFIQLGWTPPVAQAALLRSEALTAVAPPAPALSTFLPLVSPRDVYLATVSNGDVDPQAVVGDLAHPLIFYALTTSNVLTLSKVPATRTVRFTF